MTESHDDHTEQEFTPHQVSQLCHDLIAARGLIRNMLNATITRDEFTVIEPWLNTLGQRLPTATVHARAVRAELESPWTIGLTVDSAQKYDPLNFMPYQDREHAAWLDVMAELNAAITDLNIVNGPHKKLHAAIVLWAEHLAQLRLHDPDPTHAAQALIDRAAQFEAAGS